MALGASYSTSIITTFFHCCQLFLVRDKGRTAFYAAVLGGTLCLLGGVGYALIRELFGSGAYPLIDEAVSLIKQDREITDTLGPELIVFGVSDGRRRRPVIHRTLGHDGRQVIETQFYIEGSVSRGRVLLKAIEDENGRWEKQLLSVTIPGQPIKYLIQPAIASHSQRWHPFKKWF